MSNVVIDKISYDPFFILGVTPEDSLEHITKEFRKKARQLHPDKLNPNDQNNPRLVLKRSKQFKVLVDCYEYISNHKQNYNNSRKSKERINVTTFDDLSSKSFDNSKELNSFNTKFNDVKLLNPNDFGYKTERIGNLNENGNNFESLKNEYTSVSHRPQKLFDNKNFNSLDFNKAFEYQQQQFNEEMDEQGTARDTPNSVIIHKTSDGFSGYNSVTLDNCASVSSFNGVMIVGDNFGESGIGYNDVNYSDYRQTFKGAKNPDKLNIPENFQPVSSRATKPLTKKEIDTQIGIRSIKIEQKNNGNYNLQEQMLLEQQKTDLQNKIEQDKKFVIKYQHLFDKQTIEDALNDRLITSKDYQKAPK